MKRFQNKTALITGAAQGIGKGIALCLASEGANIVINDRIEEASVRETLEEIRSLGRKALYCRADVSDRAAVAAMFSTAKSHFGQIDVVVSNAAVSIRERVVEAKWENVQTTLETTQFGVFHVCQMAAQQMIDHSPSPRSRGKIIVISSALAEIAYASSAAYNMAKAAINHFAETLAVELAEHRINVNVINPGCVDTPGERAFYSEEQIQETGRRLPWGRNGTPEDVGKAVAYLASDDADYVTGTTLRVDGGYVVARSTVD